MKRLFITLLILTAGIIVPESVLAQQRYQIGVCDWMVLKRQKLGEFKLAKELECDGIEWTWEAWACATRSTTRCATPRW